MVAFFNPLISFLSIYTYCTSEMLPLDVRLTILPDKSTNSITTETLDQKLKGRVGRVHFQPSDLSERVGEAFTELLDVKDSSALNQ
jgi:hypothetical protein